MSKQIRGAERCLLLPGLRKSARAAVTTKPAARVFLFVPLPIRLAVLDPTRGRRRKRSTCRRMPSGLRLFNQTLGLWSQEDPAAVTRVAEALDEDEDWLQDVSNGTEVEDGVIWVCDVGEDGLRAFTDFRSESLIELMKVRKENPRIARLLRRRKAHPRLRRMDTIELMDSLRQKAHTSSSFNLQADRP